MNRFVQQHQVVQEPSPWTHNEWMCRPDIVEADKLMMVRATMPPGYSHPFHHHPHREEIIYVVSGRAEQWVGEEMRELAVGEMAHIPAGMVHATYNPYEEPLVFLAILSPAVLPEVLAADMDPVDVSSEQPWASLRDSLPVCQTLS